MSDKIRDAFRQQAAFCRKSGSALTGQVLETLAVILNSETRTGARILNWPGDPMEDALKLRIAGGLNALARSGKDTQISQIYRDGDGDWEAIIGRVLREWDDWLYPWLDGPPQTNEVGRSGILYPGLMEIARRYGPTVELLELGASGGLNLNMDRFSYNLGGLTAGDPASEVRLAPEWKGLPPRRATVEIVARCGVDLQPLDLTHDSEANRMLAYVWPDQTERLVRAEAAISVLRQYPPLVDTGDAVEWIQAMLQRPQNMGVTRVVYHSSFLPYVSAESQTELKMVIEAAAANATTERPLAWMMKEPTEQIWEDKLMLRSWPGQGHLEILAEVHPHGAWINWLADSSNK
jgi:hypothetical protein